MLKMLKKIPLVWIEGAGKWMIRGYMVWSICADIVLLSGLVWLIFF